MRFENPHLLWALLVLVPGLTLFLWRAWRRKQWLISQFVQSRLLSQLTVGVSAVRQKIRLALLVTAAALVVIILARPQWGFSYEEARQRGLDIIVAIDTSNSMLAGDVPPNRLERARLAVLDLLKLARTDRLGLIAFAGSAFLQCPLTTDDQAFRQSLDALNAGIIPQGGTALAEAIRTAQESFEDDDDNYKVLVLFTDGEDHDGKAADAARQAERQGLRIFTVGVGTANGELIRTPGAAGAEFLKDENGQVVKSRLNETLLRNIAESANGFYLLLSGANTMDMLYERGLAPLPKTEFASRQVKRWHERYQWFLGLVLVLLLIEMFVPERKRVARKPHSPSRPPVLSSSRVAGWLLLSLTLSLAMSSASAATPQRAFQLYHRGDFERALAQYTQLLEATPHDARLHFNAGAAAYQATNYIVAEQHFRSSLLTEDIRIQQQAYYNLGNISYRLGQQAASIDDQIAACQQAIEHYNNALKLAESDEDALFNKQIAQDTIAALEWRKQQLARAQASALSSIEKQQYIEAYLIMAEQFKLDPTNKTDEATRLMERSGEIATILQPPAP